MMWAVKNRWKEVTNTTARTSETVTVRAVGNQLVECTPNHEFYSRPIGADCWGGTRGRHVQQLGEATWTRADEMVPEVGSSYEGVKWASPSAFPEMEIPSVPADRVDNDSEAFWRMVGLWLGDGWLRKRSNRNDPPHGLRIAGSQDGLYEQLAAVEGLTWNTQLRKETNTKVYETGCKYLAHWLKDHFGEYADGKTVPAWVCSLPREYRMALLKGYADADGSTGTGDGRVRAATCSKRLALGLKHVAESLGLSVGLPASTEPADENHSRQYYINWSWELEENDNTLSHDDGDHIWRRVREVNEGRESTTVYDLTVKDDHSFVADGVVAHNCSWGPIEDDGTPSRNGEIFEQWINALHAHGYSVEWDVLNAADYGDATSRKRLFIMARRERKPEFPAPTHSEDGAGETEEWRTAAEIIDWTDPGGSIWTRDLYDGRKRPLKNSTMKRIAEGIRRHCADALEPFADALDQIGRADVKQLREKVVPHHYAPIAAEHLDRPFLVECPAGAVSQPDLPYLDKQYGTGRPATLSRPLDTITGGGGTFALCTPSLLGQHSNSIPRAVDERPAPTVTTGGKLQLTAPTAYLLRQQSGGVPASVDGPVPTVSGAGAIGKVESQPLVMPRNGARRGLHSNPLYRPQDRPLHTVTAKNTDGYLVTPSLIRYSFGGATLSMADPMPTIATEKGGVFAASNPYLCPLYNGRTGQRPRTRALDRPLMTVPASKSPAGIATPSIRPFLDDYEGPAKSVDLPVGTITSRDRFALCIPEMYPWGLDVRYRMLQPRELAAAQGFPDDYDFAGTKTETTKQIGNAVPVNLAQSLVESLLTSSTPSLTDYLDGAVTVDDVSATAGDAAVSDD